MKKELSIFNILLKIKRKKNINEYSRRIIKLKKKRLMA